MLTDRPLAPDASDPSARERPTDEPWPVEQPLPDSDAENLTDSDRPADAGGAGVPAGGTAGGTDIPAGPGRRIGRLLALGEVLLCSDVPTQVFVMGLLALAGMAPAIGSSLSLPYIVALLTMDAVLLIALIIVLLRRHGERPGELFWGHRPIVREAALGLALTPLVFVLAVAVLAVLRLAVPSLQTVPKNPLEELLNTRQNAVVFAFVAIFAGGVREEVQRAFILHRFEQHLGGVVVGIVVFSAAFGAGHLLQGADVAITTAVLGAVWGTVYYWRRSIVAPAVSHAAFNLIQIVNHRLLS